MNEINFDVQMNAHQLETYKAYRSEIANLEGQVSALKEQVKDATEALVEALGMDKKEQKGQIKAIKKSIKLYVKQSQQEEKALTDAAAELAEV